MIVITDRDKEIKEFLEDVEVADTKTIHEIFFNGTCIRNCQKRLKQLNELVNKYSLENNKKLINTKQKVLLTEISSKDNNKLCGYTESMKLVNVTCDKNLIGTIQEVLITDAKSFSLDGIIE